MTVFKWKIAILIIFLCLSSVAMASHFRGGIIQWRPLNATNFDGNIVITHRMAWRRSHISNMCTSADIGTTALFGEGSLTCASGCSGTVGTLQFYCTNFDEDEDWASGTYTYTYHIGTNISTFETMFTGCCWVNISLEESARLSVSGVNWEIRMRGDLQPRSDNGMVNSSPITTTTPIVRLQYGCTHTVRIPIQDADQDVVRCRWATGNECGAICNAVPGATIIENTCVLTWTANHSTGWYAAAIQVEDFISSTSTTPMSSVPLQFLFFVFSNSEPCTGGVRPSLVDRESPPDDSCIPVPFGTTYTAGIVADSGGPSVSITRFSTSSPFGLRTSNVVQSPFNSEQYYVNVTWTPTTNQLGKNLFCFRAVSSNGLESNQTCITLLGGISGPTAQANSVSPSGQFSPSASTQWNLTFDQSITRPSASRYIRFYDSSNNQNVYSFDVTSPSATFPTAGSSGRTVTFSFSFNFVSGASYHIMLDSGVAVGSDFCNQESLSETSQTFWTFSTEEESTIQTTAEPKTTEEKFTVKTTDESMAIATATAEVAVGEEPFDIVLIVIPVITIAVVSSLVVFILSIAVTTCILIKCFTF